MREDEREERESGKGHAQGRHKANINKREATLQAQIHRQLLMACNMCSLQDHADKLCFSSLIECRDCS
jgi:hypothetical protein